MKNKAGAVILNFFLRAVMGICLIYFINQYVLPDQDSWKVGINGLSSACFMEFWCIKVCKVFTKNCNLGKAYGQGGKLRL
jgi:hypothetical protein